MSPHPGRDHPGILLDNDFAEQGSITLRYFQMQSDYWQIVPTRRFSCPCCSEYKQLVFCEHSVDEGTSEECI